MEDPDGEAGWEEVHEKGTKEAKVKKGCAVRRLSQLLHELNTSFDLQSSTSG